jgi:hypothetical protein
MVVRVQKQDGCVGLIYVDGFESEIIKVSG